MRLYTVFTSAGEQRRNALGMTVLCHSLDGVRKHIRVGDTVQAFGNAGHSAGRWSVVGHGSKLILSKVKG